MHAPLVLNTDRRWYDHLSRLAAGSRPARLDEVNFWAPRALDSFASPRPATPVFLRLKAPDCAIAGYGFFASHLVAADVHDAWDLLGAKNGAATLSELAGLLGRDAAGLRRPLGCTLLRDVVFWNESRWLPWGAERGFRRNIVRGRAERDPENVQVLLDAIAADGARPPLDLADRFRLVAADGRTMHDQAVAVREGQGTFRARLLDAYGRRCAITGEHTEPVLEAAHIQPYLGPESNHVQNGLLVTSEFHKLLDRGLVAVEPPTSGRREYRVRVSGRIRERWKNGHRYNGFDDQPLVVVPDLPELRPSREALEWHLAERFEKVA